MLHRIASPYQYLPHLMCIVWVLFQKKFNGVQYVTLQNYFLHPCLVIYFYATRNLEKKKVGDY
jgi:hypothetical protein